MRRTLLPVLLLIILLSSCNISEKNKQYQSLIQENSSLKEDIERLGSLNSNMQKELESLKDLNDYRDLSVSYIGYEQQYRYIESGKAIHWFPADTAIKVTVTSGNTLAEVLFAGYTTETDVWLFVSIPTFDTPSNNMGWIRESDTEKYSKLILKDIETGIIIRKGVIGYQDGIGEEALNKTQLSTTPSPQNFRFHSSRILSYMFLKDR